MQLDTQSSKKFYFYVYKTSYIICKNKRILYNKTERIKTMKKKIFVTAIGLATLLLSAQLTVNADEVQATSSYNAKQVVVESASDLNLGGSFVGHGSPNLVTRGVSLNIDGLTNAGDAFNFLNRGDGSANFTRDLDSVGFLTNDNFIQNSIQFNRVRSQMQSQNKAQKEANYNIPQQK